MSVSTFLDSFTLPIYYNSENIAYDTKFGKNVDKTGTYAKINAQATSTAIKGTKF